MNKKSKGDPSPYDFASLSGVHQDLLDDICLYVSTSKIGDFYDEELLQTKDIKKLIHPWDGSVFKEFVEPDKEFVPEFKKQLKSKEIKINEEDNQDKVKVVNYDSTFKKMHTDGIGKDAAIKAFCVSAKLHGRSVKEHLKAYLHSRSDKVYKIRGFQGHEDTIERLLAEPFVQKEISEQSLKAGSPSVGDTELEEQYIHAIYEDEPMPLYVGDAIEIAKIKNQTIQAITDIAFDEDLHVFEGKFSVKKHKSVLDAWTEDYSTPVQDHIRSHIAAESGVGKTEGAKVGFLAYNYDSEAGDVSEPLVIAPLNHLVTACFNRKIAKERIAFNASSGAHSLWQQSFSKSVIKAIQGIEFCCPSQLFVELGLVTSDGYIPITHKEDETSVYGQRNNEEKVRTCGFERGPNWNKVIRETDDKKIVTFDLRSCVEDALKKEFSMANMADWENKKQKIEIHLSSYVIQAMHLNTAILGFCNIPYTKDELEKEIKGKLCGGLNHSELEFIQINECKHYVDKYCRSTGWHGTAVMRLKVIAEELDK